MYIYVYIYIFHCHVWLLEGIAAYCCCFWSFSCWELHKNMVAEWATARSLTLIPLVQGSPLESVEESPDWIRQPAVRKICQMNTSKYIPTVANEDGSIPDNFGGNIHFSLMTFAKKSGIIGTQLSWFTWPWLARLAALQCASALNWCQGAGTVRPF